MNEFSVRGDRHPFKTALIFWCNYKFICSWYTIFGYNVYDKDNFASLRFFESEFSKCSFLQYENSKALRGAIRFEILLKILLNK